MNAVFTVKPGVFHAVQIVNRVYVTHDRIPRRIKNPASNTTDAGFPDTYISESGLNESYRQDTSRYTFYAPE